MISNYIHYLVTNRGYAVNTTTAYEKDLRAFVSWMKANKEGARWSTTERQDIEKYVQELHAQKLSPATIGRKVSSIRNLFTYMQHQGLRKDNPARYVASPKKPTTLPDTISADAITKVLNGKAISLTTKVQISIMAETGIRLQECLDLQADDIDQTTRTMRIHGKGSQERIVLYGERTAQLLAMYVPAGYQGKLFTQTQREVRAAIWTALQSHPHALRHTFATQMLQNGANLQAIQWQLGHKSVTTTERYAHMGTPLVRQQYYRHAPAF